MAPNRLAVVVLALALAGFAALAAAYPHDPVARWDAQVADWVAASMPRAVERLALPFTWVGGLVGLGVVTLVAMAVLARRGAWLDAALVASAFAAIQVLVVVLKLAFDRPRPDVDPSIHLPSSPSYPSGHAAGATVTLGVIALVLGDRTPAPRRRALADGTTAALALAIGSSRVVLGVHYVTDVLAGWLLGLAVLAAVVLVRRVLRRRPWPTGATRRGAGSSNLAA